MFCRKTRAHAIRPEIAAEDENVKLEALLRAVRRAVPIGDDGAAEGIRRSERHERHGVERGMPEEAVDCDAAAATCRRAGLAGREDRIEKAARGAAIRTVAIIRKSVRVA